MNLMKRLWAVSLMGLLTVGLQAQRTTDRLDRGLVAVQVTNGVYCSWRVLGEEYYDVKYNLYRDGTLIAENLEVSNYTDNAGSADSRYTVAPVVRGEVRQQSAGVQPWTNSYLEIKMDHGSLTSTYVPNDACCADVDGDGEIEILLKFDNASDANNRYMPNGWNGEYAIVEVYKLDGTKLWWLDFGPNMGDFQNNENNIVAYDWDGDGKAEAVMRAADGTVIHAANGQEYVIGDRKKNYRSPSGGGGANWFMHEGAEYLVYMNGETGVPYTTMEYPLKRLEAGETDLEKAWGDGYGHRSTKHFFGAPYLDGRRPSIFLARGIYTRHKMIALDVNPQTHELTERWRWNCSDSSSPWYANGYHNYAIADVDWDGRDEICFGSMIIDDNGKGLSTTNLGHGDAQHHGDFDPYSWGLQIYACNEDQPSNNYRDATTSKIRYRLAGGSDDGRSMAGNFCNDYPGAMGFSAHDAPISCVTNGKISGLVKEGVADNMRIYWDGDLCEETFNYSNGKNTAGAIYKYKRGAIETLTGSMTNNDTKGTPCFQGDILGDWREEVIMRTAQNNIRIYTTRTETPWRNYTLWHDMQYRQAMVWQMCGYNQPPHISYFLGELEGITVAPPPLTETGRDVIPNGATLGVGGDPALGTKLLCETNDMTVSVQDGFTADVLIVNAPSWVQGTNSNSTTNPDIKYEYYTHTLTGGAFTGAMRLVKQGDGTLVLPAVTETHSGPTDVWAGKLRFDGTMQNSRVWLNRHTSLYSDGGQFPQGIQADYNATIYPGGDNHVGTITVGALMLGFGSRVVFDVADGEADQLLLTMLTVEKKVWPNGGGPAYDAPIFMFQGDVPAGTYVLGKAETLEGDLGDIFIEGLNGKKAALSYADQTITLTVQEYEAGDIRWIGGESGRWDTDATANFLSADGESVVFVPGSRVTFTDEAVATSVSVYGNVTPASITFDNNEKNFILSGDSIAGEPTLTKSGEGQLTIRNQNHMGNTTISGGTLAVSTLANNSGTDYGALGNVSKTITIMNGATLSATASTVSDQPIIIGEGDGNISVSSGATLTQSASVRGASQVLTKTGGGTLVTPTTLGVKRLVVRAGTVQATENGSSIICLPDTVEFQGGTLRDPVSIYSYSTNNTHFVVPAGQTGTFYADSRCNYKGKLKGSGTFNVYATSVRGYFQGNWSEFEGTLVPGTFSSDNYDDNFFFDNNYGLPKATLRLNSGVTFDNNGHNVTVSRVTGTGTLGGNGTYTIGSNDDDIEATFASNSPITKRGNGYMRISAAGRLTKALTVEGGELRFSTSLTSSLLGSSTLTVKGTGSIVGSGQLASLTMEQGTAVTPCYVDIDDGFVLPATLKTTGAAKLAQGVTLTFLIKSADSYSKLQPKFFTMNGTVCLEFIDGYEPAAGDAFTLWEGDSFLGTPTLELPDLPDGLYWDATALLEKTGVLRITDDAAVGIGRLAADAEVACEVYTTGGQRVLTLQTRKQAVPAQLRNRGLRAGTYIVKMHTSTRTEVMKVVIR